MTEDEILLKPVGFASLKLLPRGPGIYRITHLASGNDYIGSAVSIYSRARAHRSTLGRGVHHSARLQRIFTKYGEHSLTIEVLEMVAEKSALVEREQHYIDTRKPTLNTAALAGSILGVKRSDETKAKLSAMAKERAKNPEYLAKLSAARAGYVITDATRQKIAATLAGRSPSPETRRKISLFHRGKTMSDSARANMSIAQRGRVVSAETCARISASKKGKKPFFSDEQRAKKSESMRIAWIARRAKPVTAKRQLTVEQKAQKSEKIKAAWRAWRERKQ